KDTPFAFRVYLVDLAVGRGCHVQVLIISPGHSQDVQLRSVKEEARGSLAIDFKHLAVVPGSDVEIFFLIVSGRPDQCLIRVKHGIKLRSKGELALFTEREPLKVALGQICEGRVGPELRVDRKSRSIREQLDEKQEKDELKAV